MQFHENAAVIAWWQSLWGRALVWWTPPPRRRAALAIAAVAVGVGTTLQTMARYKALPVPQGAFGLADRKSVV